MEVITDPDTNEVKYVDDDGEEMKECCYLAEANPMPGTCGDCHGGYPFDPIFIPRVTYDDVRDMEPVDRIFAVMHQSQ